MKSIELRGKLGIIGRDLDGKSGIIAITAIKEPRTE